MTPHEAGLVVAAWRRHYSVLLDAGGTLECVLKGRRTVVACGDRVQVARIAGGGAIEKVEPRTSLLYRSDAFREKVLAANVTQVVGVVAPDIAVDENLLNRWIVAAELERCRFVLVANKADLPGFPALVARLAQEWSEAPRGEDLTPIDREREAFGKPLAGFQVSRHKLADMATRIAAIRALTGEVTTRVVRGELVPGLCAMAKNAATDACSAVSDAHQPVLRSCFDTLKPGVPRSMIRNEMPPWPAPPVRTATNTQSARQPEVMKVLAPVTT